MPRTRPTPDPGQAAPPAGPAAPDPGVLAEAAETFAMLASPQRLHLLWLLSRHEYDVSTLA